MNYGLPYKGSKNSIAVWVCFHIPDADINHPAFVEIGYKNKISTLCVSKNDVKKTEKLYSNRPLYLPAKQISLFD